MKHLLTSNLAAKRPLLNRLAALGQLIGRVAPSSFTHPLVTAVAHSVGRDEPSDCRPAWLPGMLAMAMASVLFICPQDATAATQTFSYTGGEQTFVVPAGVTSITFDIAGAQGGKGYLPISSGGLGGRTVATYPVTPGQTIYVYVGGSGGNGGAGIKGAAGFNGGGLGASYTAFYGGGGGGGASDVRIGGNGLANRVLVAGGGGGAAINSSTENERGGPGGGLIGGTGFGINVQGGQGAGSGGTQVAGGTGGTFSGYGTAANGVLGTGSSGLSGVDNSGGGGGGGYYGGGGGVWSGGGGGSSFLGGAASSTTLTQGVQSGNGSVVISYTAGSTAPTVALSTASLASNASTLIITGTAFDTTPGNNTVVFNNGAVGSVTAATATQLTVTFSTQPSSFGSLTAVVTNGNGSSGAPVQVATVYSPTEALVVVSPGTILQNSAGQLNAGYTLESAVDQTGLLTGYTSGVTSFNPYIAGNPLHENGGGGTHWLVYVGSGTIDFDLGSVQPLKKVVVWNWNASHGGVGLTNMQVFASSDAAFTSPVLLDSFPVAIQGNNQAQVKTLSATTATRYVRLIVTSGVNRIGFGELAFGAVATPTVTSSTASLASNATTITITGSGFDTTPGNNTVVFSNGAVGTVTAATDTTLTVTFSTPPTSLGNLTAVVTTSNGTSGAPVQVATVSNITATLTGGALTITDVANGNNTLSLSESAGNLVIGANSGSVIGSNAGTGSGTNSVSIPLASITGLITVNAAGGTDTINVGTFATALNGLTLNGGTGNDTVNLNGDITFVAGTNLDLDLQNDDATPGADWIFIGAGTDLITSGSGAITMKASTTVNMTAGSGTLRTENGDITLEGNQQATPQPGAFYGVVLGGLGSRLVEATGSGNIVMKGRGGVSGTFGVGIAIEPATVRTNTGNITMVGTGAQSAANLGSGIQLGFGTVESTGGGSIDLTGTGAGTGLRAKGINFAGFVRTTGAGAITLTGTGSSTGSGSENYGVDLHDDTAVTIDGSGLLTVNATGGANASPAFHTATGTNLMGYDGVNPYSGNIIVNADSMSIANAVIRTTGTATLRQKTNGTLINLGAADSAGLLGLTDAELDQVTAGTLAIGDVNSGAITVSAVISPAAYNLLDIQKGVTFATTGGFVSDVTSAMVFEKIKANGAVSISTSATLSATAFGGYVPAASDTFTILDNTSASTTTGNFSGKPEGTLVAIGGVNKRITYVAGTGNDVVLAAVPVSIDPSGNLAINDTAAAGEDNTFVIVVEGANYRITDVANGIDESVLISDVTGKIIVNGNGGDDTLTLDYSGGNILDEIEFNGGGNVTTMPGDQLVIVGGSFATATYDYTNANDGTIQLTGQGLITYTGLEPISNSGTATDVILNLPVTDDAATLTDNGATLTIGSGGTFETTVITKPTGSLTINGGAGADSLTLTNALDLSSSNTDFAFNLETINLDGGTVNTGTGDQTYGGAVVLGTGTALTAANINAGDIDLGVNMLTMTVSASSGIITGEISGDGGIIKNGNGTLALNGVSTYSGDTTISAGTLQVGAYNALGSGGVTLNDAGTGASDTSLLATFANAVNGIANNITVANSGSGLVTIGSTNFNVGAVATLFTGTLTLNRATTLTGGNADRTTYTNVISGNVGTLTIAGDGRTTLQNNNNFTGNIVITGTGTSLQVGVSGGLTPDQIPDSSNVDVGAGTFLQLVYDDETIGGLSGMGTVRAILVGARVLTVGGGDATASFGGVIEDNTGTMALTKTGTGTLLLNGTNTHTGLTTVSAGTLGGTGSVGGNMTLAASANLAPGASVGTFTVGGDLDLSATTGTGALGFELDTIASSDRITVTGALAVGTGSLGLDDFTFTDLGGLQNGTYTLIGAASITGTLDAGDLTGPFIDSTVTLQTNGGNLELVVVLDDYDMDGTPNRADSDDDNDGFPDVVETANGSDTLDENSIPAGAFTVAPFSAAEGDSGTTPFGVSVTYNGVTTGSGFTIPFAAQPAGEVLHYSMDEAPATNGVTLADSSGSGNSATLNLASGDAAVPGRFGGALSLPGNNITDYAISNPVSGAWPTTALTVSAWVKSTLPSSANRYFFSYAVPGSNNEILISASNVFINGTLVTITPSLSPILDDGEFHHIAVTWDSAGGALAVYMDGVPSFTGTVANGESIDPGGSLVLGQDQDVVGGDFDASQAFGGLIDEVFVFNRALSPAEVAKLANDTALSPGDYDPSGGTLTFAGTNGETQTATVQVVGDEVVELDETFTLSVPGAGGTVTITNDDTATITIADATPVLETDSGTTQLVFDVTLDNAVDVPLTVGYATADDTATTADSDYTAKTGTLGFSGAAGQTLQVTVDVTGDCTPELDEDLRVALSNILAGGREASVTIAGGGEANGTILNDDFAPQVTGSGIADRTINTSSPQATVALFPAFEDVDDADTALTYTVTANTNAGLVMTSAISSVNGILTLTTPCDLSGTADITVTVQDPCGLTITDTFTVTVVDDILPVITCAKDIVVTVPVGGMTDLLTYMPIGFDACEGTLTVTCIPASGTTRFSPAGNFPETTNTVQCSVTDSGGNTVTSSFQVIVLEQQPVGGERYLEGFGLRGDAVSGTGLAGDATIFAVNNAFLNDEGDIVFDARLMENGTTNRYAVFRRPDGGAPALVAVEGASFAGGAYGAFSYPAINNDGDVSFQSLTSSGGANAGHFVDDGGGAVASAIRLGAAPTGVAGETYKGIYQPALASNGNLLTPATLVQGGPSVVTKDNDGLITSSAAGDRLLVREGDPSGLPDTVMGHHLSRIMASNANERYAFPCFLHETPQNKANNTAVFTGVLGGAAPAIAVRKGAAADGTPGTFGTFLGESINGSGELALRAWAEGGGITVSDNEGIWFKSTSAPPLLVAREGDVAPCIANGLAAFGSFKTVYMGDDGSVFFIAYLRDAAGSPMPGSVNPGNDASLWLWRNGVLDLVVREGDPGNNTGGSVIGRIVDFDFNGNGGIVYSVEYVPDSGETTTRNNQAVYVDRGGLDLAPLLVLRRGDRFDHDGDPGTADADIASLRISTETSPSGSTGGYGRAINIDGKVLLNIGFTRSAGLFVLGTPPGL